MINTVYLTVTLQLTTITLQRLHSTLRSFTVFIATESGYHLSV